MARIVVSDPARADVRDILNYLATRGGRDIAERYAAAFKATYGRLSDFPDSGAPRPELGGEARVALIQPFVLIYEHNEGVVTILRVLHEKRDIARDLLRR